MVRLVSGGGRQARYACLSHRWGQDYQTKTTSITLDRYSACIPWEELTRTFQDAVLFTRRLGLDFLWIDSLCIIQDDLSDWGREAGNMASIFSHALITLSAIASKGSSSGLFSKTTLMRERIGAKGEVYVNCRRKLAHFECSNAEAYPLFQRGWVYQERLLSPRTLHFAPDELFWECAETARCECEWPSTDSATRSKEWSHRRLLNSVEDVTDRWRMAIEEYSGLQLTRSSDRLIALAGIAQNFRGIRDDDYVAGLWTGSLVYDLLWARMEPDPKLTRGRAPTWSWASTDGKVKYLFGEGKLERLVKMLDVKISAGLRGTCKGYIVLVGKLAKLSHAHNDTNSHQILDLSENDVHVRRTLGLTTLPYLSGPRYQDTGFYPDRDFSPDVEVYGLLIAETRDTRPWAAYSLVLRRSTAQEGCFDRVGLLATTFVRDRLYEEIQNGSTAQVKIV
jgi:hypothetical protein